MPTLFRRKIINICCSAPACSPVLASQPRLACCQPWLPVAHQQAGSSVRRKDVSRYNRFSHQLVCSADSFLRTELTASIILATAIDV
ncbi:hypothetical protein PR003_g1438 [Phytophthora rubi]|uniref:Uncharacterized protein n=1 Tax=Phytophthora rubi TaxID=129364 RepID=A0A6A3MDY5_9STRA|nr:hypothetical protein PR002_g9841 [Phytophthora rubi]KAE9034360.1 hypothetical protein PR001_g9766 [Phytophthora rubi]KAE9358196.1 hypothetical protein PR003_g1438 [Phytophthora rubi]